mmetsp:Transcript_29347/g.93594  ORF Transcript_29347/g.93594 Transcript_29347/m.93594 type:complete len:216 (-) Transcript_29347:79-726(-)
MPATTRGLRRYRGGNPFPRSCGTSGPNTARSPWAHRWRCSPAPQWATSRCRSQALCRPAGPPGACPRGSASRSAGASPRPRRSAPVRRPGPRGAAARTRPGAPRPWRPRGPLTRCWHSYLATPAGMCRCNAAGARQQSSARQRPRPARAAPRSAPPAPQPRPLCPRPQAHRPRPAARGWPLRAPKRRRTPTRGCGRAWLQPGPRRHRPCRGPRRA